MAARRKILLADDERAFREQFCSWFPQAEIVEAETLAKAWALFQEKPGSFNLAILDYFLNGGDDSEVKDTFDLIKNIHKLHKKLPIIMVTGVGDRAISRQAIQAGATWYLEKPVDKIEAEALINTLAHSTKTSQAVEDLRAEIEQRAHPAFAGFAYAMASTSNIPSLLREVARTAPLILGASQCTIAILNAEGNIRSGLPHWDDLAPNLHDPYENRNFTRELAENGGYRFVSDTSHEEGVREDFLNTGIQSFAAAACPQQPGARAVLYAYFNHSLRKYEQQLRLKSDLTALAHLTGMAIERLRQEELNKAVRMATEKLQIASTENDVYEIVRETIAETFDVSAYYIATYDAKTELISFKFLFDEGTVHDESPRHNTEAEGGLTGYIIRSKHEFDCSDLSNPENMPVPIILTGTGRTTKSYFGVPVQLPDKRVIGVISIQRYIPLQFHEASKQALRSLAAQVALALNRIRSDAAQEQVLEGMTTRPWQDILREIGEQVKESTQADIVTIHPYDFGRKTFAVERIRLGLSTKEETRPFIRSEGKTLERLLEKGEHFAEDAAHDSIFERQFADRHHITSSAGITLRAGRPEIPVGVLVVNYRTPRRFSESDEESLRAYRRRAALALYYAWLAKGVETASRRMEAEHQALDAIHEAKSIHELVNSIMQAVQVAWPSTLVVPSLLLSDPANRRLIFPEEAMPFYSIDMPEEKTRDSIEFGEGICGWVAEHREALLVNDVSNDTRYLKLISRTKAELCVPIFLGGSLLGVLDIEAPEKNFFEDADRLFLERIAQEIAIWQGALGEQRYADEITSAGRLARQKPEEGLTLLTQKAYEIAGLNGANPTFATIFLSTPQGLEVASASPPEYLSEVRSKAGPILLTEGPSSRRKGIVVRALNEKTSQKIDDVRADPDYIEVDPNTRAELAVPILAPDGSSIGVVNVEYSKPEALDEGDRRLLETLASQTEVITVMQKQALELAETQRARSEATALALMSIAAIEHGHGWKNTAVVVSDNLQNIEENIRLYRTSWRGRLAKTLLLTPNLDKVAEWIERAARRAQELKATTPPPSLEKNRVKIQINSCLEAARERWKNREEQIDFEIFCETSPDDAVNANKEWLIRALDNLIANATHACYSQPAGRVMLHSLRINEEIQIEISDNGTGIPEPVVPYLFLSTPPEELRKYGWGTGCLIAQFIARSYGGRAYLVKTDSDGTTVAIKLPSYHK